MGVLVDLEQLCAVCIAAKSLLKDKKRLTKPGFVILEITKPGFVITKPNS